MLTAATNRSFPSNLQPFPEQMLKSMSKQKSSKLIKDISQHRRKDIQALPTQVLATAGCMKMGCMRIRQITIKGYQGCHPQQLPI